jgi:hypothetical protein
MCTSLSSLDDRRDPQKFNAESESWRNTFNGAIVFLMLLLVLAMALAAAPVARGREQNIRLANEAAVPNVSVTLPALVKFTRPSYTDEARRRVIEGSNRPGRI